MSDISRLLGIKYPIVQGAMARIADSSLAAAVSNGGGLGIIASGGAGAAWAQEEIYKVRKMTDRPFGVNIMLLDDFAEEVVDLVCQERVPVVTTGAGNPGKYIERFKEKGIKVIPVTASVALAIRLERAGADAIIAEGTEAGGHIGETTTMVLIPQVIDAVSIPVIAAGGIGDGRGAAAAFMLGAKGIQIGTRFVVANECTVAQTYKEAIIKAKDTETVATGRSSGHPVRVLKNKMTREVLKMEKDGATQEEIDKRCVGLLRLAVVDGDVAMGSVMSGQIAGLIKKEQPAAEIIEEIFKEASQVMKEKTAQFSW